MCGIAGYIGKGTYEVLQKMIKSLEHRGPDFLAAEVKENVGLAHARLSIVDLSSNANQPFYLENGRYGIVFNGEIYNFHELKKDLLENHDLKFKSTSDTEVLLYLYIFYDIVVYSRRRDL
jgi:asparagine synthase (glutamine-hydrolysing)